MRAGLFAIALAIAACNPGATQNGGIAGDSAPTKPAASAAPLAVRTRVEIVEAPAESDAISLIRTKRLEAKAAGRVLVVYVGATWCEPCKKFKGELDAGRLDERLGRVMLLTFDVDKDQARLGAAGYTFKFVPFVALPAPDGSPADTQQATGKGGDAWRELLTKLDAWQKT